MSDYMKYSDYKKEKKEMNDFQKRVISRIDAWAKSRPYPCSVSIQHTFSPNSISAEPEIERTALLFLPCGYVEIHWDECRYISQTVQSVIKFISAKHGEFQNRDRAVPAIEKVIFNDPATIIFWKDGTKTVVKCGEKDIYDAEKGMAMAIAKKALGNKGNYCNEFKKWVEPYYEEVNEWFELSLSECFKKAAENLSDFAKKLNSSEVEESESLKGVEDGKAIGEGFVDGVEKETPMVHSEDKFVYGTDKEWITTTRKTDKD